MIESNFVELAQEELVEVSGGRHHHGHWRTSGTYVAPAYDVAPVASYATYDTAIYGGSRVSYRGGARAHGRRR